MRRKIFSILSILLLAMTVGIFAQTDSTTDTTAQTPPLESTATGDTASPPPAESTAADSPGTAEPTSPNESLPATASPLPLILGIGIGAGCAFVGMRLYRLRHAQ
jgi:hypothetical protein